MRQLSLSSPGKALRKFREVRGLTGREFADKTGISQGHVSELENGRRNLTAALIDRITEGFSIPKSEFLIELERINDADEATNPFYSTRLMEDPAIYTAKPPETPSNMQILAEYLVSRMSSEERAAFLRELTELAIAGDAMASSAAQAMLPLIRKFST